MKSPETFGLNFKTQKENLTSSVCLMMFMNQSKTVSLRERIVTEMIGKANITT